MPENRSGRTMRNEKGLFINRSNPFTLHKHPWLSLLAIILTSIISMIISNKLIFGIINFANGSAVGNIAMALTFHIVTIFILTPFILRLPKGKTSYKKYLKNIGLSTNQKYTKYLLLALTCSFFLLMSQAASSIVYRFIEGQPITHEFIVNVFDLSLVLPSNSPTLFTNFPSIFEELVFRGIVLSVFLGKYSERESIVYSSIGFGFIHILNLTNDRELVWVMGQVIWAFSIGCFYGYVYVETKSLLPSMIVHYLGNVFVYSLAGYIQNNAPPLTQAIYGVIFTFGIVPTTLMILWARFFLSKWDFNRNNPLSINITNFFKKI